MKSIEPKAMMSVEQALKQSLTILPRLWVMAFNHGQARDGAHIYDELFGGEEPLLPLLQEFGELTNALDGALGYQHAEVIDGGTFSADSWHGVLAQWCGRVAGYASTGSGALKRQLDGRSATKALAAAIGPWTGIAAHLADPDDAGEEPAHLIRRGVTFYKNLEWYAAHVAKATTGLLDDGKLLKIGLEKELRTHARDVARLSDDQRLPPNTGPMLKQDVIDGAVSEKPAAEQSDPPAAVAEAKFTPVEKAVALLLRDGKTPRSMREYAEEVGVSHTTLSRNETWQRVWQTSQELAAKGRSEIHEGSKDKEGNLEASAMEDEVCENCRVAPSAQAVQVGDEVAHLCEACAKKHAPRTK